MHSSQTHMRITSRLGGLGLALVSSLLLLGLFSGAASASVTGYCTSGTTQWNGGDGSWGAGNWSTSSGNWSNGYPSSACDTVINGNVTVTFTTISDHYGNEDTANAGGLTLSGGATLVVQGESDDVQGNWYNATNLNVGADGLSIGQGSTLELEASNATATPVQGTLTGGTANLTVDSGSSGPANLTNNGAIVASTSDAAWGESLNDGGTVANNGSLTDQSGQLTMQGQGNTAYVFDNSGSYTVASGASAQMIAGDGSAFTNTGTIANQGTFTLQQSMHWNQNGGSDTGNPVELTGGETLEDSSGAGSFEWTNCTTAGLNGTIPANQTITVVGGCSGTTLFISPGSTTPVANHGTIILEAPAGASDGILSGNAELDNYGTIDSNVGGALPLGNQLLLPLVNESGGTVNLSGGELEQTSGSATTNNGTVDIGPGSTWLVQGGSFTNAGAIGLQIAGASNLGTFNLTAGSKFTAGGTLAAALASGYQPAAGTEFPIITENGGSPSGTFGSVSGGFSADYTKETASPGYVGLVYGTAGPAANPTPTPTTTSTIPKAVLPTATRISGGARSLLFKLTCPRSAAAACAYALSGTVGRRRVAAGHGVVKPGRSITVTLRLNRIGATLLRHHRRLRVEVLVRSGAATIKTSTVTVTRSGAAKKKK